MGEAPTLRSVTVEVRAISSPWRCYSGGRGAGSTPPLVPSHGTDLAPPTIRLFFETGMSNPMDEKEILSLLMKWRTRVSGAAWSVVRDAHVAEDIFQNVAVKAMTRDVSFEAEGALLSWAFITARREGIDYLRKHRREVTCLDGDVFEMLEREWQQGETGVAGARVEALRDCLEAAPEEARRLMKLRYFDGYSCGEVARQMGLGLDAVYKRVSRLHESLRSCVEGKMDVGGREGGVA